MPDSTTGRVGDIVRKLLAKKSVARLVGPDADLRQAGITSLDMVNLVLAVEAEFDVMIPEADMTPANFRSVRTIADLAAALMGAA